MKVKSGTVISGMVAALAVMSLASLPSAVHAETPSSTGAASVDATDPMIPYRAYEAAIGAGNVAEAATQAYRAWQLAETKWGNSNPNTAGLAFNASWSAALVGKGPERIDAARRAVELAPTNREAFKAEEAAFLLAYAEFLALPVADRVKKYEALADAAEPIEASWGDILIVDALVHAAHASVGYGRGRTTVDLADRALAVTNRLMPADNTQKAVALALRGQGRLFTRSNYDEAMADFVEARVLYGVMRRTDDTTWGHLAAWQTASQALGVSAGSLSERAGTRISRRSQRPVDLTDDQKRAVYGEDEENCDAVTRKTNAAASIQYPPQAANQGSVAGIVVRTDIAPDGSAQNVRLLGAVPGQLFGEAALRGVRTWKYNVPAGTSSKCMVDRDIFISFIIS